MLAESNEMDRFERIRSEFAAAPGIGWRNEAEDLVASRMIATHSTIAS